MIFGDENVFAIELYHEPLDNDSFFMTGRMCLHLNNNCLGDVTDLGCHLYVTYHSLKKKINSLENLKHDFACQSDEEIFEFLDSKLYVAEDDISYEQILLDVQLYSKFDFLTNDGEMFDRTKSFAYVDGKDILHILYQIHDKNERIVCVKLDIKTFTSVTNEFIQWYEKLDSPRD